MTIRLLLADDHQAYRAYLRTLLERQPGMAVLAEAADGAAGVALALELLPDVTILDVDMPGLDGIAAARQILAARPQARVLMLSMQGDPLLVAAAARAGARAFVRKDSPLSELVAAIRAVADGREYFGP